MMVNYLRPPPPLDPDDLAPPELPDEREGEEYDLLLPDLDGEE